MVPAPDFLHRGERPRSAGEGPSLHVRRPRKTSGRTRRRRKFPRRPVTPTLLGRPSTFTSSVPRPSLKTGLFSGPVELFFTECGGSESRTWSLMTHYRGPRNLRLLVCHASTHCLPTGTIPLDTGSHRSSNDINPRWCSG